MKNTESIAAIVVTHNPEINILKRLLDALGEQVGAVVIVDNGSGHYAANFIESRCKPNEHLLILGGNFGVAAGQNAGIEWARKQNRTHVIIFDQDSLPTPDMVFHLVKAMRQLLEQGIKVAAVGPLYRDERNKRHSAFIKISGLRVHRIFSYPSEELIRSDILISSGSLIALSTLSEIGGPLNDLFIDQVDLEWCFRARSQGYFLYGVCKAVLKHSLGDAPQQLLGRKIIHHSPLRHYYIFRNIVWLIFRRYVPVGWKIHFITTIFMRFFFYSCFVSPRWLYCKLMSKGIWHGLKGRLGRLEASTAGEN